MPPRRAVYLLSRSVLLGSALLAGCAIYHREPLNRTQTATTDLTRVRIDPKTMPLPELAAHRFDPSDGLDMTETAMLAVANNPALQLARDDLGIAQAQAFAAGLLPDPQLNIASDYPSPGPPGSTRAFNYGLSMDLMSVLTRPANQRSANATVAKTDLGLLWQEWQTVAQARQLFLKAVFQDRTMPWLVSLRDLTRERYQRTAQATASGNLTQDAVTAALISYQDAAKQLADAQRQRVQTRHDLNALLGVAPQIELPLVGGNLDVPTDANDMHGQLDKALALLPRRRPDLLALEAGYQAEEAKYRAAILSQFPSLTVGFVRARDTSNVYTSGFQINLSLPIFNRNQGNIAVEKATRQRLRDDYQGRLNQAYGDVDRIRADNRVLTAQLASDERALPGLQQAAHNAQQAFDAHNLALGPYTDAQMAALTKQLDAANLEETLAEQHIALQALLGSDLPAAYSPDQKFTANHAQ